MDETSRRHSLRRREEALTRAPFSEETEIVGTNDESGEDGAVTTVQDLDGCLATINAASCPKIMSGKAAPPACYTIQH